jgi:hypothetical protein
MKPVPMVISGLVSWGLLSCAGVAIARAPISVPLELPAPSVGHTMEPIPTTAIHAHKNIQPDSQNPAQHPPTVASVTSGFDAAIRSGDTHSAFQVWLENMVPEVREGLQNSAQYLVVIEVVDALGAWKSYDLLGSIHLDSSETELEAQLVYVQLETEHETLFWQFIITQNQGDWQIMGYQFDVDRNKIISDLEQTLLGL